MAHCSVKGIWYLILSLVLIYGNESEGRSFQKSSSRREARSSPSYSQSEMLLVDSINPNLLEIMDLIIENATPRLSSMSRTPFQPCTGTLELDENSRCVSNLVYEVGTDVSTPSNDDQTSTLVNLQKIISIYKKYLKQMTKDEVDSDLKRFYKRIYRKLKSVQSNININGHEVDIDTDRCPMDQIDGSLNRWQRDYVVLCSLHTRIYDCIYD